MLPSTWWYLHSAHTWPLSYRLNHVPLTTNSHTPSPRFLGSRKLDSPGQYFHSEFYFWVTRMLPLTWWCLNSTQARPFLYEFTFVPLLTNTHTSTPLFFGSRKLDSPGQFFTVSSIFEQQLCCPQYDDVSPVCRRDQFLADVISCHSAQTHTRQPLVSLDPENWTV